MYWNNYFFRITHSIFWWSFHFFLENTFYSWCWISNTDFYLFLYGWQRLCVGFLSINSDSLFSKRWSQIRFIRLKRLQMLKSGYLNFCFRDLQPPMLSGLSRGVEEVKKIIYKMLWCNFRENNNLIVGESGDANNL